MHLASLSGVLTSRHSSLTKKMCLQEWFLVSLASQRANRYYESRLLKKSLDHCREGILVAQIRKQKKVNGAKFLETRRKGDLLWLLGGYVKE